MVSRFYSISPYCLSPLITVIFVTSFSGACCRIIEMILVISARQQINVLKIRQLLNYCAKKQLCAQSGNAK